MSITISDITVAQLGQLRDCFDATLQGLPLPAHAAKASRAGARASTGDRDDGGQPMTAFGIGIESKEELEAFANEVLVHSHEGGPASPTSPSRRSVGGTFMNQSSAFFSDNSSMASFVNDPTSPLLSGAKGGDSLNNSFVTFARPVRSASPQQIKNVLPKTTKVNLEQFSAIWRHVMGSKASSAEMIGLLFDFIDSDDDGLIAWANVFAVVETTRRDEALERLKASHQRDEVNLRAEEESNTQMQRRQALLRKMNGQKANHNSGANNNAKPAEDEGAQSKQSATTSEFNFFFPVSEELGSETLSKEAQHSDTIIRIFGSFVDKSLEGVSLPANPVTSSPNSNSLPTLRQSFARANSSLSGTAHLASVLDSQIPAFDALEFAANTSPSPSPSDVIITFGSDGDAKLWQSSTRELLMTLHSNPHGGVDGYYCNSSGYLAVVSCDSSVTIYSVSHRSLLRNFVVGRESNLVFRQQHRAPAVVSDEILMSNGKPPPGPIVKGSVMYRHWQARQKLLSQRMWAYEKVIDEFKATPLAQIQTVTAVALRVDSSNPRYIFLFLGDETGAIWIFRAKVHGDMDTEEKVTSASNVSRKNKKGNNNDSDSDSASTSDSSGDASSGSGSDVDDADKKSSKRKPLLPSLSSRNRRKSSAASTSSPKKKSPKRKEDGSFVGFQPLGYYQPHCKAVRQLLVLEDYELSSAASQGMFRQQQQAADKQHASTTKGGATANGGESFLPKKSAKELHMAALYKLRVISASADSDVHVSSPDSGVVLKTLRGTKEWTLRTHSRGIKGFAWNDRKIMRTVLPEPEEATGGAEGSTATTSSGKDGKGQPSGKARLNVLPARHLPMIATWGLERHVILWDPATGRAIDAIYATCRISGVCFVTPPFRPTMDASQGTTASAGSQSSASGPQQQQQAVVPTQQLLLLVMTEDRMVRLWDISTLSCLQQMRDLSVFSGTGAVYYDPLREYAFSATARINLWRSVRDNGVGRSSASQTHVAAVTHQHTWTNEKILVTADSATLRLWNSDTGAVLSVWPTKGVRGFIGDSEGAFTLVQAVEPSNVSADSVFRAQHEAKVANSRAANNKGSESGGVDDDSDIGNKNAIAAGSGASSTCLQVLDSNRGHVVEVLVGSSRDSSTCDLQFVYFRGRWIVSNSQSLLVYNTETREDANGLEDSVTPFGDPDTVFDHDSTGQRSGGGATSHTRASAAKRTNPLVKRLAPNAVSAPISSASSASPSKPQNQSQTAKLATTPTSKKTTSSPVAGASSIDVGSLSLASYKFRWPTMRRSIKAMSYVTALAMCDDCVAMGHQNGELSCVAFSNLARFGTLPYLKRLKDGMSLWQLMASAASGKIGGGGSNTNTANQSAAAARAAKKKYIVPSCADVGRVACCEYVSIIFGPIHKEAGSLVKRSMIRQQALQVTQNRERQLQSQRAKAMQVINGGDASGTATAPTATAAPGASDNPLFNELLQNKQHAAEEANRDGNDKAPPSTSARDALPSLSGDAQPTGPTAANLSFNPAATGGALLINSSSDGRHAVANANDPLANFEAGVAPSSSAHSDAPTTKETTVGIQSCRIELITSLHEGSFVVTADSDGVLSLWNLAPYGIEVVRWLPTFGPGTAITALSTLPLKPGTSQYDRFNRTAEEISSGAAPADSLAAINQCSSASVSTIYYADDEGYVGAFEIATDGLTEALGNIAIAQTQQATAEKAAERARSMVASKRRKSSMSQAAAAALTSPSKKKSFLRAKSVDVGASSQRKSIGGGELDRGAVKGSMRRARSVASFSVSSTGNFPGAFLTIPNQTTGSLPITGAIVDPIPLCIVRVFTCRLPTSKAMVQIGQASVPVAVSDILSSDGGSDPADGGVSSRFVTSFSWIAQREVWGCGINTGEVLILTLQGFLVASFGRTLMPQSMPTRPQPFLNEFTGSSLQAIGRKSVAGSSVARGDSVVVSSPIARSASIRVISSASADKKRGPSKAAGGNSNSSNQPTAATSCEPAYVPISYGHQVLLDIYRKEALMALAEQVGSATHGEICALMAAVLNTDSSTFAAASSPKQQASDPSFGPSVSEGDFAPMGLEANSSFQISASGAPMSPQKLTFGSRTSFFGSLRAGGQPTTQKPPTAALIEAAKWRLLSLFSELDTVFVGVNQWFNIATATKMPSTLAKVPTVFSIKRGGTQPEGSPTSSTRSNGMLNRLLRALEAAIGSSQAISHRGDKWKEGIALGLIDTRLLGTTLRSAVANSAVALPMQLTPNIAVHNCRLLDLTEGRYAGLEEVNRGYTTASLIEKYATQASSVPNDEDSKRLAAVLPVCAATVPLAVLGGSNTYSGTLTMRDRSFGSTVLGVGVLGYGGGLTAGLGADTLANYQPGAQRLNGGKEEESASTAGPSSADAIETRRKLNTHSDFLEDLFCLKGAKSEDTSAALNRPSSLNAAIYEGQPPTLDDHQRRMQFELLPEIKACFATAIADMGEHMLGKQQPSSRGTASSKKETDDEASSNVGDGTLVLLESTLLGKHQTPRPTTIDGNLISSAEFEARDKIEQEQRNGELLRALYNAQSAAKAETILDRYLYCPFLFKETLYPPLVVKGGPFGTSDAAGSADNMHDCPSSPSRSGVTDEVLAANPPFMQAYLLRRTKRLQQLITIASKEMDFVTFGKLQAEVNSLKMPMTFLTLSSTSEAMHAVGRSYKVPRCQNRALLPNYHSPITNIICPITGSARLRAKSISGKLDKNCLHSSHFERKRSNSSPCNLRSLGLETDITSLFSFVGTPSISPNSPDWTARYVSAVQAVQLSYQLTSRLAGVVKTNNSSCSGHSSGNVMSSAGGGGGASDATAANALLTKLMSASSVTTANYQADFTLSPTDPISNTHEPPAVQLALANAKGVAEAFSVRCNCIVEALTRWRDSAAAWTANGSIIAPPTTSSPSIFGLKQVSTASRTTSPSTSALRASPAATSLLSHASGACLNPIQTVSLHLNLRGSQPPSTTPNPVDAAPLMPSQCKVRPEIYTQAQVVLTAVDPIPLLTASDQKLLVSHCASAVHQWVVPEENLLISKATNAEVRWALTHHKPPSSTESISDGSEVVADVVKSVLANHVKGHGAVKVAQQESGTDGGLPWIYSPLMAVVESKGELYVCTSTVPTDSPRMDCAKNQRNRLTSTHLSLLHHGTVCSALTRLAIGCRSAHPAFSPSQTVRDAAGVNLTANPNGLLFLCAGFGRLPLYPSEVRPNYDSRTFTSSCLRAEICMAMPLPTAGSEDTAIMLAGLSHARPWAWMAGLNEEEPYQQSVPPSRQAGCNSPPKGRLSSPRSIGSPRSPSNRERPFSGDRPKSGKGMGLPEVTAASVAASYLLHPKALRPNCPSALKKSAEKLSTKTFRRLEALLIPKVAQAIRSKEEALIAQHRETFRATEERQRQIGGGRSTTFGASGFSSFRKKLTSQSAPMDLQVPPIDSYLADRPLIQVLAPNLSEILHRHGANVRQLGLLLCSLQLDEDKIMAHRLAMLEIAQQHEQLFSTALAAAEKELMAQQRSTVVSSSVPIVQFTKGFAPDPLFTAAAEVSMYPGNSHSAGMPATMAGGVGFAGHTASWYVVCTELIARSVAAAVREDVLLINSTSPRSPQRCVPNRAQCLLDRLRTPLHEAKATALGPSAVQSVVLQYWLLMLFGNKADVILNGGGGGKMFGLVSLRDATGRNGSMDSAGSSIGGRNSNHGAGNIFEQSLNNNPTTPSTTRKPKSQGVTFGSSIAVHAEADGQSVGMAASARGRPAFTSDIRRASAQQFASPQSGGKDQRSNEAAEGIAREELKWWGQVMFQIMERKFPTTRQTSASQGSSTEDHQHTQANKSGQLSTLIASRYPELLSDPAGFCEGNSLLMLRVLTIVGATESPLDAATDQQRRSSLGSGTRQGSQLVTRALLRGPTLSFGALNRPPNWARLQHSARLAAEGALLESIMTLWPKHRPVHPVSTALTLPTSPSIFSSSSPAFIDPPMPPTLTAGMLVTHPHALSLVFLLQCASMASAVLPVNISLPIEHLPIVFGSLAVASTLLKAVERVTGGALDDPFLSMSLPTGYDFYPTSLSGSRGGNSPLNGSQVRETPPRRSLSVGSRDTTPSFAALKGAVAVSHLALDTITDQAPIEDTKKGHILESFPTALSLLADLAKRADHLSLDSCHLTSLMCIGLAIQVAQRNDASGKSAISVIAARALVDRASFATGSRPGNVQSLSAPQSTAAGMSLFPVPSNATEEARAILSAVRFKVSAPNDLTTILPNGSDHAPNPYNHIRTPYLQLPTAMGILWHATADADPQVALNSFDQFAPSHLPPIARRLPTSPQSPGGAAKKRLSLSRSNGASSVQNLRLPTLSSSALSSMNTMALAKQWAYCASHASNMQNILGVTSGKGEKSPSTTISCEMLLALLRVAHVYFDVDGDLLAASEVVGLVRHHLVIAKDFGLIPSNAAHIIATEVMSFEVRILSAEQGPSVAEFSLKFNSYFRPRRLGADAVLYPEHLTGLDSPALALTEHYTANVEQSSLPNKGCPPTTYTSFLPLHMLVREERASIPQAATPIDDEPTARDNAEAEIVEESTLGSSALTAMVAGEDLPRCRLLHLRVLLLTAAATTGTAVLQCEGKQSEGGQAPPVLDMTTDAVTHLLSAAMATLEEALSITEPVIVALTANCDKASKAAATRLGAHLSASWLPAVAVSSPSPLPSSPSEDSNTESQSLLLDPSMLSRPAIDRLQQIREVSTPIANATTGQFKVSSAFLKGASFALSLCSTSTVSFGTTIDAYPPHTFDPLTDSHIICEYIRIQGELLHLKARLGMLNAALSVSYHLRIVAMAEAERSLEVERSVNAARIAQQQHALRGKMLKRGFSASHSSPTGTIASSKKTATQVTVSAMTPRISVAHAVHVLETVSLPALTLLLEHTERFVGPLNPTAGLTMLNIGYVFVEMGRTRELEVAIRSVLTRQSPQSSAATGGESSLSFQKAVHCASVATRLLEKCCGPHATAGTAARLLEGEALVAAGAGLEGYSRIVRVNGFLERLAGVGDASSLNASPKTTNMDDASLFATLREAPELDTFDPNPVVADKLITTRLLTLLSMAKCSLACTMMHTRADHHTGHPADVDQQHLTSNSGMGATKNTSSSPKRSDLDVPAIIASPADVMRTMKVGDSGSNQLREARRRVLSALETVVAMALAAGTRKGSSLAPSATGTNGNVVNSHDFLRLGAYAPALVQAAMAAANASDSKTDTTAAAAASDQQQAKTANTAAPAGQQPSAQDIPPDVLSVLSFIRVLLAILEHEIIVSRSEVDDAAAKAQRARLLMLWAKIDTDLSQRTGVSMRDRDLLLRPVYLLE